MLLNNMLAVGILSIVAIFLYIRFQKRFFIVFSCITLVTITSALGSDLRTVIQVINLTILSYFFISTYGIEFKQYPKIPIEILILIILITSSMIFSALFSNYFGIGISQIIRTVLFFLIIYAYYALLVHLNEVKLFISALYITAVILFILILYHLSLANFNILYFNQVLELKGEELHINKNGIGAFFTICICILTATFFYKQNKNKSIIIALITILLLVALIITNSRGAILSLFFGILLILFTVDKKLLIKFIVTLSIAIPILIFGPLQNTIETYFKFERLSTGRDYILQATYNVIINNTIFGAGPAATQFEMYKYLPFMLGSGEELLLSRHIGMIQFGHAHNFYLFFFSDLGILGFILSLALPVIFLRMGVKTLNVLKASNSEFYFLILGIQAAGLSLFVRGLFEWGGLLSYGFITTDLPFWWIFSILSFTYLKNIESNGKQTKNFILALIKKQ